MDARTIAELDAELLRTIHGPNLRITFHGVVGKWCVIVTDKNYRIIADGTGDTLVQALAEAMAGYKAQRRERLSAPQVVP